MYENDQERQKVNAYNHRYCQLFHVTMYQGMLNKHRHPEHIPAAEILTELEKVVQCLSVPEDLTADQVAMTTPYIAFQCLLEDLRQRLNSNDQGGNGGGLTAAEHEQA